jgi:sigma-E factor negative regulatory protein RseC
MKSMSLETATVVSVNPDSLVVETIQRSTCDSCRAASGCGQAVLSTMASTSTQIRVLLGDHSAKQVKVGQRVTIGIPKNILVTGALLVYLVPVSFALIGAQALGVGETPMQKDVISGFGAFIGLMMGGWFVRLWHRRVGNDLDRTPVLIALLAG